MAIIDVDRHILCEINAANIKMRTAYLKFLVNWNKIIEVRDKTDALLFHSEPNSKSEEELMRLRDIIFKATKKCNRYLQEIQENFSKQEALLRHLVSEILEFDSGKGTETH